MDNKSIILRRDEDILSGNYGLPLEARASGNEEVRVGTSDALIDNEEVRVCTSDALIGNEEVRVCTSDSLIGNEEVRVGTSDALIGCACRHQGQRLLRWF